MILMKMTKNDIEMGSKKIYHLGTCSTNVRILKELKITPDVELHDIKKVGIDEKTLDFLKEKMGSYEALFSKKAMKYRCMGLNNQELEETDYRRLMLEEYTFLKRPFIINGEEVFIGNSKSVVAEAVLSFNS